MVNREEMKEYLSTQYAYEMENIPMTLGGSYDPTINGQERYKSCQEIVTNPQSICSPFYSLEYQPLTTKPSSNILFFNADHHPSDTTKSLVAIVALRRNQDASSTGNRPQKRESSPSTDSEKRRRSNESLAEEDETEVETAVGSPANFAATLPTLVDE